MKGNSPSTKELVRQVEAFFGEPIVNMTAPGGRKRGSFRANFKSWSVIVSRRGSIRRTNLEASVLEQLQNHTDASAQFLGRVGDLLFQSDVGDERLNQKVQPLDPGGREALADKAVCALFDIQTAAHKTPLPAELPQLGSKNEWVVSFVKGIDRLADSLNIDPVTYDLNAICEFVGSPAVQFVKWDCRSGNAGVDEAGVVRWFDFEYSGIRHGAEDFAWLIADEIWPVGPDTMIQIVKDRFVDGHGRSWDDYRRYLEVYTVLHAIQRLILIVNGAKKRGWISAKAAVKYDNVGVNPLIAMRLCETTRYLAERNAITEPVAILATLARAAFRKTVGQP